MEEMFRTRVTELLNVKYPIIQGGMLRVSCPKLAAAVSEAGGFGILTSARFENGEQLREEIQHTKKLTNKPFGVNISYFPSVKPPPNDEFIKIIIDEGIEAVETSGHRAPPEEHIRRLHEGGVKIIHKCAGLRYAMKAERLGVDMVAVVGVENGGATGIYDVTTMVLIPIVADKVKIPVIAGGGIADARGFVAALALGAEGVVMGTRFMATEESPIHPKLKEKMIESRETDTMLIMRTIRNTHRVLRNPIAEKVYEMEMRGASIEELIPWISGERTDKAFLNGMLNEGLIHCGQAVGLINEIKSAKEVINEIVEGAVKIYQRLGKILEAKKNQEKSARNIE
jgi:nitronate monooxygenase